jgi:two-component system OmpR family response regulator
MILSKVIPELPLSQTAIPIVVADTSAADRRPVNPFASSELVVRIEVLVRRTERSQNKVLALKVGDLELDLMAREAWCHGRLIQLLPMEFKLLEFMMRNAGQTLSRRMIFEHVWGYNFDPGTNLIEVHIGRLRKKIDNPGMPSLIRTERGAGYVFNAVQ